MKGLVLILLGFVLIASCTKHVTEEEMAAYISNPENGLLVEKNIQGIDISMLYKPSCLVGRNNSERDKKDKQETDFSRFSYFVLSVSLKGEEVINNYVNDRVIFGNMVNELSFGLKDKTILITSEYDTLYPIDMHYTRFYGMKKSSDVVYVYDCNNLEKFDWIKIVVEEFGLRTGRISFKFNGEDIKNIPKLKR
jgi:hypothetical protein